MLFDLKSPKRCVVQRRRSADKLKQLSFEFEFLLFQARIDHTHNEKTGNRAAPVIEKGRTEFEVVVL